MFSRIRYVSCGGKVEVDVGVFFQAEDGIRDAQESRGLGDVYMRQQLCGHVRSSNSR